MAGRDSRKTFVQGAAAAVAATAFIRSAAEAVEYKPLQIKVSHEAPVGFINDLVLHRWAEKIKAQSNGAIVVDIFPAAQLFNDENALQTLVTTKGQSVQMVCSTPFYFTNYDPSMGVFILPFGINSADQFRRAFESAPGRAIADKLKAKGLRVVGDFIDLGPFVIVTGKRQVTTPADMKGLKVRTLGGKIIEATFSALGASPVALPAPSVPLGLSQGTIDGAISSYLFWNASLAGVAKYGVDTGMIRSGYMCVFNEQWFAEQPPATQQLITKTLTDTIHASWPRTEGLLGVARDGIKAKGDVLTVLTEQQREPWKREAQPVIKQYEASIGKDIVDAFQKSVR